MQRVIKFRAWDRENRIMFDPMKIDWECADNENLYVWRKPYNFENVSWSQHAFEVGKEVWLMQFTDLHDKNGKDIFEGDIIDHYATYGSVIFEDGMFTLAMSAKVNFGYRQPLCYIDTTECKIIGNIYQNPELTR